MFSKCHCSLSATTLYVITRRTVPFMTVLTVNSIPVGVFIDVRSTQTTKAFCACIIWLYGTCISVILCVPIFMKHVLLNSVICTSLMQNSIHMRQCDKYL